MCAAHVIMPYAMDLSITPLSLSTIIINIKIPLFEYFRQTLWKPLAIS